MQRALFFFSSGVLELQHMVKNLNLIGNTPCFFLTLQTNIIHHWCSMETGKLPLLQYELVDSVFALESF